MITSTILRSFQEHQQIVELLLADQTYHNFINQSVQLCVDTFREGGKVLFCGNGGSAADAQHLAAELSGRFLLDRNPLHAEALHVNTSYLTAVANDYSFADVYARAVKAKGKINDVLVVLSTSGSSPNILAALVEARQLHMSTVTLTSQRDQKLSDYSDAYYAIPHQVTPRIQEMHLFTGHIICELIEHSLFAPSDA